GPGQLTERTFDRFQGRSVLTILAEGMGHHVVKIGVEGDVSRYTNVKAYSGKNLMREATSGTNFADYRNYGYLTGPDQAILLDKLNWTSHSLMVGGFLQDSW